MDELKKQFLLRSNELQDESNGAPADSVGLKSLLDSIRNTNLEKHSTLDSLEVKSLNNIRQSNGDSKAPHFDVELHQVPFELEPDQKKVQLLRELLGQKENGKMNGKIKFILEELKKAEDSLFQEEWKNESYWLKIKTLREDMKVRRKQIQGFNEIKDLVETKAGQVYDLKHEMELGAEEVQRELGVLQCFVDSADAKQQNKLQSLNNLKLSHIGVAEKLGNETLKNREKIAQREERLRRIKEKASRLTDEINRKNTVGEGIKETNNLLDVIKALKTMINKTRRAPTFVVRGDMPQDQPFSKSKSKGAKELTRRVMAMRMFKFTSQVNVADLTDEVLDEYKRILSKVEEDKKYYETLVDDLMTQKNRLNSSLSELAALKEGEKKDKGEAGTIFQEDETVYLVSQLIKEKLEPGKKFSRQDVFSYNQLLVYFSSKKDEFNDQLFKEKIETASSFILSGVLLIIILDSKILSKLDFIGSVKRHEGELKSAVERLRLTIDAIQVRMNTESIVRPMGSNENQIESEDHSVSQKKLLNARRMSKKLESKEAESLKKDEILEFFPQFSDLSEFLSAVLAQEQLMKLKKKNQLHSVLEVIFNEKPVMKNWFEFIQYFEKTINRFRSEVIKELLSDFDRVLFEYRSILALISQTSTFIVMDPERERTIAKGKHLLAMKAKNQKNQRKTETNEKEAKQELVTRARSNTKTSNGLPAPYLSLFEKETGFPTEFDEMENSEYFEQMHSNERAKILEMQAKALEKDVVLPKTQYVSPSHHLYLQSFRPTYKLQHYVAKDFGKKVRDYSQVQSFRAETEPSQMPNGSSDSPAPMMNNTVSGSLSMRLHPEKTRRKLKLEVLKGERRCVHPVVDEHYQMMISFNVPLFSEPGKGKSDASQRCSTTLSNNRSKKNIGSESSQSNHDERKIKSGNSFRFKHGKKSPDSRKPATAKNCNLKGSVSSYFKLSSNLKNETIFCSVTHSNPSTTSFFHPEFAPKPVLISHC